MKCNTFLNFDKWVCNIFYDFFWKNINSTCCYETTTCTRLKHFSKNSTWSLPSFVASLYNSPYQRGEGTLSPIEIVITHIIFYNYVFWQHRFITSWIIFACFKYIWLDLYLNYSKYSKNPRNIKKLEHMEYICDKWICPSFYSLYHIVIQSYNVKTSWKKSNSNLPSKKEKSKCL